MKPAKMLPLAIALASLLPAGGALAQHIPQRLERPAASAPAPTRLLETASSRAARMRAAREADDRVPKPVIGVVLAQDDGQGVPIAAVTPGSAAADAGLRTGDRLVAIDGHALLGSTGALRVVNAHRLLSGLDTDRAVRLDVLRGDELVFSKQREGRFPEDDEILAALG